MKVKKIYIELSDICGLNCDFCPSKKSLRGVMSVEKFATLASKICKNAEIFTFHILGDPLKLLNLSEYLELAKAYEMKLELTTSGFYLNQKNINLLLNYKNIKQINLSLMSFLSQKKLSLDEYFKPILTLCNKHLEKENESFINLRLWNLDTNSNPPKENFQIYEFLKNTFCVNFEPNSLKTRLARHILLNQKSLFKWPNLNQKALYKNGKCHALKEQLGILSDGTLVPCCLDTKGDINLGNVFKTEPEILFNSKEFQSLKQALKEGKRTQKLCQTCEFFKTRLKSSLL